MMSHQAVIFPAVAPVHKEPSFSSEMISQALMWEKVKIQETSENWHQIKMEDGYEGWTHHFYLSKNQVNSQSSLTITNRCTPLRAQRGIDGQILTLLSFGTTVPILEKTSGYYRIQLINGEEAFIPAQQEILKQNRSDIIKLAIYLMGVPYLWGGKSSFGYDCSGFVQMVLKAVGISIPRDTGLQIKTDWLEEISITDTKPGDLVFFFVDNQINHVAFTTGEGKIIHCSGEVKLESIIDGEPGFNNKLAKLEHTFASISKMVNS